MRQRIRHARSLALGAAWFAAMLLAAAPLPTLAQTTVTATQDLTCLSERAGKTLGCTAGDMTAAAVLTAASGTPLFCQAGQSFTFNSDVRLDKSAGNTRYDIGFFTGQEGNAPDVLNAGKKCSVTTFPFTAPFSNQEAGVVPTDTCGDVNGSLTNAVQTVQNIKVTCVASSATNTDLAVPFALSWQQNNTFTCTGPGVAGSPLASDVYTDNSSKCSKGSAAVTVASTNLQVGGFVDVIKQTLPDTDTQSFSYTATGPAGSMVGYQVLNASGVATGAVVTNNNNTVNFTLNDATSASGPGVRVFMNVVAANRTLTITEQPPTSPAVLPAGQVPGWESTASISCAAVTGSPTLTPNNTNRQITAVLNTTNSAGACTVTNTKRARVSLVKNVPKRLDSSDQFKVSVSGAGSTTLTSLAHAAITAANVEVTTSGAGTGNFANPTNPTFRATPGQVLTLTDAMASGTNALSAYDTKLTCTNAFTGSGATTGLPNNSAVTTYNLTPAPDDNITCTFTNTPKAKLTLSKVVVNDNGQTKTTADWTLSAAGPVTISGISGAGAVTGVVVPPATYTLSESGPAGYVQTSLACTGAVDTDPSDGLTLASGETATCTFTNDDQPVGQTVVKDWVLDVDADGSSTVTVGDTLKYTVTVTNTGVSPLTNVQITDAKITPGSKTCASVPSTGTCVLEGSYVVVAGDQTAGSVSNTASVTSTQIPGPVSSNTTTTTVVPPAPAALAVTKSHTGNFSAGSNGVYTLRIRNTGGTSVTGTTTVTDTLAAGLTYVSATGTNWSCSASLQVVTCTSSASVTPYTNMADITLTVAVAAGAGNSVNNTASVANPALNGGTPVAGNTDTATIVHADLSTSTKIGSDVNGGDLNPGDLIEYTITLVESAGAVANNVRVTDTVQAGLTGATVTVLPPGATNNTSGSVVDVTGITVPANGSVVLKFRVTVGAGFTPGDAIENTATVSNPAGPGATPGAPTLTYQQSQVVVSGGKRLYLRDDQASPTAQIMDRTIPAATTTGGVVATSAGGSILWTMSPVVPATQTLELDSGTVVATFPINTAFNTLALTANLRRQPGNVLIGSGARSISTPNTVSVENFAIALNGNYAPLTAGQYLTLELVNGTNGNGKDATVYAYNTGAAMLSFTTSTVVHVDSVAAYSQAYASGNAQKSYYVTGDAMYVRAVVSDPFGGADVGSAEITITDAAGNVIAGPAAAMTTVATAAANRTFEYGFTVPQAFLGAWTATVKAWEGQEGTISHTATGNFNVLGKVLLGQTWGSGAIAGNAVTLQVSGTVSDPQAGSSTAPSTTTPATAAAGASASITLAQTFTSGVAGAYTIGLSCVRDKDATPVTVTGSGLSRQIQMPLDSSVTCTWADDISTPLTVVKLVIVRFDPVNGVTNPKAIPGAIVEYQVIVTNPAGAAADNVFFSDPLPAQIELSVDDLGLSGSGPVQFVDGTPASGLSYVFTSLGNASDDIEFSNDHGATWNYQPVPDGNGLDSQVTNIRINPKGSFNGNTTGNPANDAQFTLKFRARIK